MVRHASTHDLTRRYAYSAQSVLGAHIRQRQHSDWCAPERSRWGFGHVGQWLWRTQMTAMHGLRWHGIQPKHFWPSLVAIVVLAAAIPQAALFIIALAALVAMRLMMPPMDLESQCDWEWGFTDGPDAMPPTEAVLHDGLDHEKVQKRDYSTPKEHHDRREKATIPRNFSPDEPAG